MYRKFSFLVFLIFSLMLVGMTQAYSVDVTAPGDSVKGVPDDGDWPGGEAPPLTIDDNVSTKYLHFKGHLQPTGFAVTPKLGGKVVTEITFTTANDAPHRDPVSFELYGSNGSIDGPWDLIASGDIVDFAQADPWPRFTKNATPITFANAVAYDHYQVLFTAVRDPGQNNFMQIAEVELLADVTPIAGWGSKDIGNPAIPGRSFDDAGTWTIQGSGHDIWGAADGIHYVYRPLAGDGSLQVDLLSMDVTSNWSKVGPAIRETTAAGSRHAMTAMTGANGIQFVWRDTTNGGSDGVVRTGETWPATLRVTRAGDEFIGEFGDEVPFPPFFMWYEVWRKTIPMNTDVTIGVAVCATNNSALNTAVLENITLTAAPYEKPWDMSPADGSTKIPLKPTLSWLPGDSATDHDVYLGTDPAALPLVATVTDPEYPIDTELLATTTYYWQVVEQPLGVPGPVYSFTTEYVPPWYVGTLNWERWNNMWWEEIMRMVDGVHYLLDPADDYGEVPDAYQPSTEGPEDYGVRMSGHLIPGTSGDYTFWIAGDDGTLLRLNTDNDVSDLHRIAWHYRYSGNFDANPEQKSAPIYLEGGQKYAIEILLKERGGGDWVEVAWEGPDAPSRTRISGDFLTNAYAANARPDIRSSITPLEAGTLSWTAGKYATSQEVLFGTDPAAMVSIATLPANPATLAEHCTTAMPAVASGNTYYWQVISTDGTETWVGDVWSFTVSDWVGKNIGIDPIDEDAPEPPLGSSTYDPATDTYVLNAGGHELWNDNDEFHYRYTTVKMTRDTGMIQARIQSVTPADSWRRGGVMIRENLGVASRKVMMHKTGHNNLRMQYRQNWRAGTGSSGDNYDLPYPMWVRITRNHDQFDGYFSEDGENWTHAGGVSVPMAPDKFVYIGLAQCHHPSVDQSGLSTGVFDSFSYTTPDIRQSWNLQPPNGSTMVDIHATLTWGAGDGATEHRVYFSADEEAVVNRTVAPVILPAETTELAVGPLDLGMVYYWCVDEVVNPVIPGEVVSFTAEEYRTIDDFEAYDVEPEALPEQQFVPGPILVEAVPPPPQEMYPGEVINEDAAICTDPDRGQVLCLSGGLDYVDCGNPAALNFGTGDWSMSAWVKNTMTGTGDQNKGAIIANGGDTGGGHRYCLILSEEQEGKVTLVVDDDVTKVLARGDTTLVNDGVWHHVLGVRDGDTIRIYINGTEEGSASLPAGYDLSGTVQHNVLIGAITDAPDDTAIYKTYGGMIDDARIYDYALTADNALFLADKGGTAPATDPIADWKFDGDFTDSSASGFDGTPRGYTVLPASYGPLVAHWEFEGNTDDSTDNHNDGTLIGDATIVTDAERGDVLSLDGSGDYVNIDGYKGVNAVDGVQQPFTVANWFKTTGNAEMVTWGTNTGGQRLSWRIDGGTLRTEHGSGNLRGNTTVNDGEWHHGALVVNEGANLQVPNTLLYVDGQQDTTYSGSDNTYNLTAGADVSIGRRATSNDRFFNGQLDDVRIYNYALSEGEMRYLAGVGDLKLPDSYIPMIGEWKMEADFTDTSGNNYNGTAIGDAAIVADAERGNVGAFDADGDAVNVGNSELFNPLSDMTISAWVNLNSWAGSWGNVIVGKRGEDGVGWQLRRFGGDPRWSFTTRGIGDDDYPRSNLVPNMNQWYHLAAVRDGTQKRLYIDGVLDSTGNTNSNQITPCVHNVYIGARANGGNTGPEAFFDGKIDDLRIYNTALTLGQIRNLSEYTTTNTLSGTWSGRAAAAPALQYAGGAHEGAQCMRVEYTGSGAVTRLEPWNDGKHPHGWNGDFTLGKAQALTLYFKGDPDNAPGILFAQLTTVVPSGHTQRVLYDGDPEDILMPDWKEWNISLHDLSTGKPDDPELGLPITKIKDVGIGVIGAGGGVIYVDDIRLNPLRCVPKYGPAKDLDGDCDVDEADLRILLGDWAWQSNPGVNGVRYEYYEDYFDGLDDFDVRANMPTRVGVKANFDISGHREDGFGYRFLAKVAAPVDGYYNFHTSSDDGSELYIDGIQVVDNDGFHGMQWRSGTKYLTAGLHDIMVTMFEWGGGQGLQVEVDGPGVPRIPIPNEVLFLPDAPDADLNGDGIVNFLDYADILNSYIDAVLWPTKLVGDSS